MLVAVGALYLPLHFIIIVIIVAAVIIVLLILLLLLISFLLFQLIKVSVSDQFTVLICLVLFLSISLSILT